jgi:predicted DNA-binding protein (MmcQ/YjbR family)
MPKPTKWTAARLVAHLRERGLARYPGAHLKSPWPGHLDLAVDDKTFAYLSAPEDPPSLSLKLPESHTLALAVPGASPTGYGLGKSGWVSFALDAGTLGRELPPPDLFEDWLDESYRAQAPKKRLAAFAAAPVAVGKPRPTTRGSRSRPGSRARPG